MSPISILFGVVHVLFSCSAFVRSENILPPSVEFQAQSGMSDQPPLISTISVVGSHVSQLGEGPYWDKTSKLLYYVDALNSEFHRLNPATGEDSVVTLGSGLVSMIIPFAGKSGQFLVSHKNKLLKLDWNTGSTSTVSTISPELNGRERFNDAKADRRGRVFIGTVLEGTNGGGPVTEGGSLYRVQGTKFVKVATGFTITNGMAWSNDPQQKKFYLNDSEGRKIYSFDYNIETGTLSNKVVLIDCDSHPDFVPNEYPDGMAIDRFGYIWVAMWNGARVVKINPITARVVSQVVFPRVKIPSSVAFGDYNGKFGLYVTTAATGIPPEKLQDDGKIHHINIHGGEIYGFNPNIW